MPKQLPLFKKRKTNKSTLDPSIRHRKREVFSKPKSMHLTIKIEAIKGRIKNKSILKVLKRAILRARGRGLRIVHFTLEYNHVHLLVESSNEKTLALGMMVFGVTFSKGINKYHATSGRVYRHRYHQRFIKTARDLKHVMNYIFTNGIKHQSTKSIRNIYNSFGAEIRHHKLFTQEKFEKDPELTELLDPGEIFFKQLNFVK